MSRRRHRPRSPAIWSRRRWPRPWRAKLRRIGPD